MIFETIKRFFVKEKFELVATLKHTVDWVNTQTRKKHSSDVITWYMEQGNYGSRRYHFHSYGESKSQKVENGYEAELILWKKTGILPKDAEPIEFTAMKNSSKP
jgi:hypothetical protein